MVGGYFWSEGGLKKFIHIHGLDGSISEKHYNPAARFLRQVFE